LAADRKRIAEDRLDAVRLEEQAPERGAAVDILARTFPAPGPPESVAAARASC